MDNHTNLTGDMVLIDHLIYIESENILISCLTNGTCQVVPVSENFKFKTI